VSQSHFRKNGDFLVVSGFAGATFNITMRPSLLLLILFLAAFSLIPANSSAQPGFHFVEGTPDTLHFFTNSSQSIAVYAKNTSDVALHFYPDYQHTGGNYGQWDINDETFPDLSAPGAIVKTVITYTPDDDTWFKSTSGKIYLYDTGFVVCDSIYFIGVKDTNREFANALRVDTLLDFGKVDLGRSHSTQLLLKNVSAETLIIDTMMINGFKYVRQYSLTEKPSLPLSLQPNATHVIEVTFTPDGSPAGGWNDLMINYHIGETFQTATIELDGRTGKFAVESADTLDLGPIPMYAFVGKKVRLKNNLSDSVEVYDYYPMNYPNLVVVMDAEGDSMVLGPQEEKEVIIYGLGMGFEGQEQEVALEFTTHNGPLFHLGFVNVIVKTTTTEEDVENPERIFPLMANTTMFIPYGTSIEMFGGGEAQFGEILNFENVEDHNISVTEVLLGDSASTGYVTTSQSLPATLAATDLLTVNIDVHDTVTASGWLLITTDSSDIVKTKAIDLPPIVAPTKYVDRAAETIDLRIRSLGNKTYNMQTDGIEKSSIKILDIAGRLLGSGKNEMTWTAPTPQAYLILVEGWKNDTFVRRLEKLFVP
jgi:hypothetical protein